MRERKQERRNGPDFLQKTFVWVSILAWGLFLAAIIIYHYARPEIQYSGFSGANVGEFRNHWDEDLRNTFTYLLWACCGITLIGIALNSRRSRRRNDHFRVNLGLLALISFTSLLAYYWVYLGL